MSEQNRQCQASSVESSDKKVTNNKTKKSSQTKSKKSVEIKPDKISIHFTWALILTIFCFFVIGPCWALYKTSELRRLIVQQDFKAAKYLSNKISSILVISTIIGVFAWVSILFCSAGLLLTGVLLKNKFVK